MKDTTIREVIEGCRRNINSPLSHTADISDIAEYEFDIRNELNDDTENRFIQVFFRPDSFDDGEWFGGSVYFLDNEPVILSWANSSGNESLYFISKEAVINVENYINSLIKPKDKYSGIIIMGENDLNESMPSLYAVEFSSNIIHQYALYLDIEVQEYYPVKVLDRASWDRKDDKFKDNFHGVEIEILDTKTKHIVNCQELFYKHSQRFDEIPQLY